MSNLFDDRSVKPMLIGADDEPFDDPEYVYEMKWDGERCLAYLDPKEGTELRNKRQVRMLPKVPELSQLHKQVKKRCILDGELVIVTNGKPDFSAIQRRSLMSNHFKIELDAKQRPASFVAFDVLYCEDKNTMDLPLVQRKKLLSRLVKENDRIAVSRFIEGNGIAFYQLAKDQSLEGIVAKRKESLYMQGKRTKDWVKIKYLQDDDFVVCGYIIKSESHMISLVLGQYDADERLLYKGHVTLGVGGNPFRMIESCPKADHPPFDDEVPAGHKNEDASWLHPALVCTVKYMEKNAKGGLRQPVFKGLREDKAPKECRTE